MSGGTKFNWAELVAHSEKLGQMFVSINEIKLKKNQINKVDVNRFEAMTNYITSIVKLCRDNPEEFNTMVENHKRKGKNDG